MNSFCFLRQCHESIYPRAIWVHKGESDKWDFIYRPFHELGSGGGKGLGLESPNDLPWPANSCSKRAQGQGGLRLTPLSSSGYFAAGCSGRRDHGCFWGDAGHPHWGSALNSTKAALSTIWEEAKSCCLHPSDLPCLISTPVASKHSLWSPLLVKSWMPTAPLQPFAIPSVLDSGTAANSTRIRSFHALLSELHTGITSNNTRRTENTYFPEDVHLHVSRCR